MKKRQNFTLIELLVSAGTIAILAAAVTFLINPVETFRSTRDGQRIANINSLSKALYLYESTEGGSIGEPNTIYVSVPDPEATSTLGTSCAGLSLPTPPTGWTYRCAGEDRYKNIDGTGWLPLNFSGLSAGGIFTSLPVDPMNATSSGLFFTYTTDGGLNYEFTSAMESKKYGLGGPNDVVSTDGGKYNDLYEVGLNLALAPVDFAISAVFGQGQTSSNYIFGGFQEPIKEDGSGVYNLGRTLPVKFSLTDMNGNPTTSPTAQLVVTMVKDGVVGTEPITLESSGNDVGNIFRVAGGQYIYNLDTDELGAGTWQLKAVLSDGSSYPTIISLRGH